MPISLRDSALQIVQADPDSAVPLYDVLLFMAQPKATLSPDYDETKELLYAMTADSRAHRGSYEKKRVAA